MTNSILIADDDPVVRDILSTMLSALGYRFESAASGQEALQMAQLKAGQGQPYTAIFLDMQLGDMTGVQVLQGLRNKIVPFTAKTVFLSAHAKRDVDIIFGTADADYYLEKPFSSEQIAAILNGVFTNFDGHDAHEK